MTPCPISPTLHLPILDIRRSSLGQVPPTFPGTCRLGKLYRHEWRCTNRQPYLNPCYSGCDATRETVVSASEPIITQFLSLAVGR